MEIGKIPNDILERIINSSENFKRKEVLVGAGIGEDCSVLDFGNEICVLSTDPITGAANEIGRLAVHVSCNDVASNGVQPLGLLITILVPEETELNDINGIMKDIYEEASKLKVQVIGGHTEVTTSVNRIIVSSTCIGKGLKNNIITSSGAKIGDKVIMTKYAGLEGSAIIANDRYVELENTLTQKELFEAKELVNQISVVKEGIIAGKMGASAMHDVTEGGVLGAIWEMAEASKIGVKVYKEQIPILETTKKICKKFNIDPLRLISSGVMLIASNNADKIIDNLNKKNIKATIIGEFVEGESILIDNNEIIPLSPPDSDELFKI